jgi:DNA polymerase III epsilon subunit-like protein
MVFFDTETGGLLHKHPTIQLAAIAVGTDWRELETFESKIAFDVKTADPEVLAMNHYDAEAWKGAPSEREVVTRFSAFLGRHRSISLVSKRTGNPYTVARVAGHNIAGFDLDRVGAMFKRHDQFFPVDFRSALDTRYGAAWYFERQEKQPENFRLTGIAEFFGMPFDGAHEALFDVRLSIEVAKRLLV